jgi:hypothetical protein
MDGPLLGYYIAIRRSVNPGCSVVLRCHDRLKEGKQHGILLRIDNFSPYVDALKNLAVPADDLGSDDELPH